MILGYRLRQGQSMVEVMLLLAVVVASLLIMQVFIKRSYMGRIKQEADQVGPQYSPKHTASLITSNSTANYTSYTGGVVSGIGVAVPDGVTLTISDTNTTYSRREAVDSFHTEE